MTLCPSDAVRQQLDRVLNSATFSGSAQLRRILKLLVESALASPPRRLNPYAIATLALNRSDQFEAVKSSIVRVELRRFRKALVAYYQTEGRVDPILFELPSRQYDLEITPHKIGNVAHPPSDTSSKAGPSVAAARSPTLLSGRSLIALHTTKHRPVIAILCPVSHSDAAYTAARYFVESAVRFDLFHYILIEEPNEIQNSLFDYIIHIGTQKTSVDLKIFIDVKNAAGVLLYQNELVSKTHRRLYREYDHTIIGVERSTIDTEVMVILDDRGVIACHYVAASGTSTRLASVVLRLYRYFCNFEMEELRFVNRALPLISEEEKSDGYYAILRACLCIDQLWRGENKSEAFSGALEWSLRAMEALPTSAHATYVHSLVSHSRGRAAEALRLAEIAHKQNPLDSIVAVGLATRQLYAGREVTAKPLLYLAYPHLSARPQWVTLVICNVAILEGNDDELLRASNDLYSDSFPMIVAVRLVAAAVRGSERDAASILSRYSAISSEDGIALMNRIRPYFGSTPAGSQLVEKIEKAITFAQESISKEKVDEY